MNDVASTSLLTVKRPATSFGLGPMTLQDFSRALLDLEELGFLRVYHAAIDSAVIARGKAVEEIPLERVLAGEGFEEDEDGVDRAEPRRERDSSAQTYTPHAASAAKEKSMLPTRIEEVFALVEKGMSRSAVIAEKLSMGQSHCGKYLRELVAEGRVEHRGSRVTSRFYVSGKAPAAATVSGAKVSHASPSRPKPTGRVMGSYTVHAHRDVKPAKASFSAFAAAAGLLAALEQIEESQRVRVLRAVLALIEGEP